MVTSLARQSIIIKCLRQRSVMVGNYEFYYTCGLMKKLYKLDLSAKDAPLVLEDKVQAALPDLHPEDEKEQYLLHMVRYYEPTEDFDQQMKELFAWGAVEPDLWSVNTKHFGSEFIIAG